MPEKEVRRAVEIRLAGTEEDPVIEGTAIVFNQKSADIGFREIMDEGSVEFDDDLLCDFDHQSQYILGRESNSTLETIVDSVGVHFRAKPPKTQWAKDLIVSMREGYINQCSFMFRPLDDEWSTENGEVVRHVKRALVMALSIVSQPAYPQTSAQARSKAAELSDAAPIIEESGEDGGSPLEPVSEGGSPHEVFVAGRFISFPEPQKEA